MKWEKIKGKLGEEKGFTLMELAVVIAIIGILLAVTLPRFTEVSNSAKEAKAKVDIRTIMAALELYYADKGDYPSSSADDLSDFPADFQKYLPKWPAGATYSYDDDGSYTISVVAHKGKTITQNDL